MPHAAYTALPDTTPDPWPNYEPPSGWDIDWPFPGPSPPGYDPEDPRWDFVLSGNSTVPAGDTYTATLWVVELNNGEYYVTEPPDSGSITWTATLDGNSLLMSIDGSDYGYSIDTDYAAVFGTGYYGDQPVITFDLDDDDVGKTIILTATGDPFGDGEISDTLSITVEHATYSIQLSVTIDAYNTPTGPSEISQHHIHIDIDGTVDGKSQVDGSVYSADYGNPEEWETSDTNNPSYYNLSGNASSKTVSMSSAYELDESLIIEIEAYTGGAAGYGATVTIISIFKKNGVSQESDSREQEFSAEEVDDLIDCNIAVNPNTGAIVYYGDWS